LKHSTGDSTLKKKGVFAMTKLFTQNSNFRNFLLYQVLKGIGSGIFAIFMMWAVHYQFQNTWYTAVAGFMFAFPSVASFVAGPFVDRRGKAALIRIASFVQICVIGFLLAPIELGVWAIFLAILIFAIANMISSPAEKAILPSIVNGDELIKANALINILGTVTGLAIGIFLYFTMVDDGSFSTVFLVNIAALIGGLVFAMLLKDFAKSTDSKLSSVEMRQNYFAELKTGFAYVKKDALAHLVIVFACMSIIGNMAYVNLPMFAEIHRGDGSGYIILMAVSMVGGVVGSYIANIVAPKFELGKIFIAGLILMGIARIVFVHVISNDFRRALLILVLYSGLASAVGLMFHSMQQKMLNKNIIGRVSTIITTIVSIAAAGGALVGGLAGTLLPNVDMVFIIQGVIYIIIGLGVSLSGHVRKLPKISDVEEL